MLMRTASSGLGRSTGDRVTGPTRSAARISSRGRIAAYLLLLGLPVVGSTQSVGDAALRSAIDATSREWLQATRAPSVSIAVVRDGKLLYSQAYGAARLQPRVPATVTTRYAIDSVSKQFTATALLLLSEQGVLSLDDPVSRWYPDLGDASGVTLRQLLTHTSGIRDYWPQDFVPPEMSKPTSRMAVFDEWIKRPLDFQPGTDWQYSNSAYYLAASIAEQASGEPLLEFLQRNVFSPLDMRRVTEDDSAALQTPDAAGYTRFALGPVNAAPKEGAGWLFGAAELAMQPSDLARWDISIMNRTLLKPTSYDSLLQRVQLTGGLYRDYGLGLFVGQQQGRLHVGHDGAGSGYLAANWMWPDEHTAVIVLTNNDWAGPDDLVDRIAFLVLQPNAAEARARELFAEFQKGSVDHSLFTPAGNSYLTAAALEQMKHSLAALGPARLIVLEQESKRGGMITRRWKVLCRQARLQVVERGYPDGKLEQFLISPLTD